MDCNSGSSRGNANKSRKQQTKGGGNTNISSSSDTKITNNNTAEEAVTLLVRCDFFYRHLLLKRPITSWVTRCSF